MRTPPLGCVSGFPVVGGSPDARRVSAPPRGRHSRRGVLRSARDRRATPVVHLCGASRIVNPKSGCNGCASKSDSTASSHASTGFSSDGTIARRFRDSGRSAWPPARPDASPEALGWSPAGGRSPDRNAKGEVGSTKYPEDRDRPRLFRPAHRGIPDMRRGNGIGRLRPPSMPSHRKAHRMAPAPER